MQHTKELALWTKPLEGTDAPNLCTKYEQGERLLYESVLVV